MKTTLLRHFRHDFRIIQNELGDKKIQERALFRWKDYNSTYENLGIQDYVGGCVVANQEGVLKIIRYRYRIFKRKYKIYQKKRNTWTKIWYV